MVKERIFFTLNENTRTNNAAFLFERTANVSTFLNVFYNFLLGLTRGNQSGTQ